MRQWLDAGLEGALVAVILSARQFRQKNLAQTIWQVLLDHHLSADLLALELTESSMMHDVVSTIALLEELKAIGLRISIDDFGTGYSSFSYLKRFPINELKIDRRFIRDIASDPDDAAIALAVIGLEHTLNMRVVAKGAETGAQPDFLRSHR